MESVSPDEEWVEKFACGIEPVYCVFETNDEVICDCDYERAVSEPSIRRSSDVGLAEGEREDGVDDSTLVVLMGRRRRDG